ncbi:thiamine pyrophosphate-dependent enzyme [Streptomyces sp. NPDC049590]|uniref:thiamine pyrophosphate-dependent enzyme n=1 Tax=Streptomyces sp. NPDC049590 TaxID=3154834 RepID=UPI0034139FFE
MTQYFSDAVVEFLHQQGFEYVAFNPGASFRGVHDSLVHEDNAAIAPSIVMACHEEIAVAIAHGYYKASNRHMAVFTHANVGLLHASMALFNAWCDRVPLFVVGGNGPLAADLRRPWIDWIHTSQHLPKVVEDFVKWSDQPIGQRATLESLYRAHQLMDSGMKAPVFVTLDFDVQEQPLEDGVRLLPADAARPAVLPALDSRAAGELAARLRASRLPVLVVDFSGQDPRTLRPLVALAEATGAAVVDRGNRLSFPSTHPQNVSGIEGDLLAAADLVIALDVQDLASALGAFLDLDDRGAPPPGTHVVTIGPGELLTSKWSADHMPLVPVAQAHSAQVLGSVEALLAALAAAPGDASGARERAERTGRLAAAHHKARATWAAEAERCAGQERMAVSSAVARIHEAVRDEEWVIVNSGSVTVDTWVRRLWPLERPLSCLGLNGGGGLGYGPGASVGAALAHKGDGTLCIDLQSDGDFLFTPSALWSLSAYDVPLLVVVMNNRQYQNSTRHAERIAAARDRATEHAHIGTGFEENPVDFVTLARAYNVHALERVESLDGVVPAITEAVAWIKEHGRPVLVELLTE